MEIMSVRLKSSEGSEACENYYQQGKQLLFVS